MNENRNRRKIIVNADDFGITAGVNQAIIELAESGAITSTSLMTNMPLAAGATLVKHKIGTGVHLNLTTGRPVSDPQQIPSLVNRSGEFHCLSVLLQRYRTRRLSKSEIELEFTAQMKRAFEIGMCPDHFDAHESLLKYPLFEAVARKVAHDFGVNAVRTYRQQKVVLQLARNPKRLMIWSYLTLQRLRWERTGFNVTNRYESLFELGLTYRAAVDKLRKSLRGWRKGVLEMAVHPGYVNGAAPQLGGYVYEREIERRVLSSQAFQKIVRHSGVEPITFEALVN